MSDDKRWTEQGREIGETLKEVRTGSIFDRLVVIIIAMGPSESLALPPDEALVA